MTREEAIKTLRDEAWICCAEKWNEALEMAIEALKAEPCERQFEKIMVEYPPKDSCTYPEYKGKPYFSIQYIENGERFIGFGTYKPEVLSRYLKDYFMQPKTEPCGDCVGREAVLKTVDEWYDNNREVENIEDLIVALTYMPSVTPETPVAHWVAVDDEPHEWYECDHCGYSFTTKSANIMPEEENKYCPNCGADMRGTQE